MCKTLNLFITHRLINKDTKNSNNLSHVSPKRLLTLVLVNCKLVLIKESNNHIKKLECYNSLDKLTDRKS